MGVNLLLTLMENEFAVEKPTLKLQLIIRLQLCIGHVLNNFSKEAQTQGSL